MVRSMTERMTVVGVFHSAREAQAAIRDLKAAGFRDDEIGVVGPGDSDKAAGHSVDGGTHAAEGAAAGVATGAGVGALWAIGIAAGLLPAIGPIVAGGILGSLLASAAGGAAIAGLAGALVGLGIPEDEANYYENEFKAGRTVVTVKTTTRQDEARRILGRHNSYDMESRPDRIVGGSTTSAATTGRTHTAPTAAMGTSNLGTTDTLASAGRTEACDTGVGRSNLAGTAASVNTGVGGQKVQLREEELHAQKVQHQAGEVRVHKDVITEHKTIEVPVTREEVVIERHAAHGTRATGDIAATGQEIRIPVKEEEVRVTKTPVVKEEVTIGKRKVTETQTVAADVKHEELRIDETGDVNVNAPNSTRGRTRKGK